MGPGTDHHQPHWVRMENKGITILLVHLGYLKRVFPMADGIVVELVPGRGRRQPRSWEAGQWR
jgi:hypothetical protein